MEAKFLFCCLLCFPSWFVLSSQNVLMDCGVPYVDPQNNLEGDTLIYQELFSDNQKVRNYYIDINAFGGQQVDRIEVFAILPDENRKRVGSLAFGNCSDCIEGFALMLNDSIMVREASSQEEMELWLDAFGQPTFSLTGNLQTLVGVGRISGDLPVCATGFEVLYQIAANPNTTTTQFATQIVCPTVVRDCTVELQSEVDCQNDQIALIANVPNLCYSENTLFQWRNEQGWTFDGRNASLPLAGNEGWYYLEIVEECCSIIDSIFIENRFQVDAGLDQTLCEGQTATFSPSANEAFQEIGAYWESPDGAFSNFLSFDLEQIQLNQAGNYVFHATNLDGCKATDTLQVTVNSPTPPEIEITKFCIGDTAQFILKNENAFLRYEWRNPIGVPTENMIVDFSMNDEGIYSIIATDSSNCNIQQTFDLQANALEEIEVELTPFCDSTTILLHPTEYFYEWETGETGATLTTAHIGNFEVIVSNNEGCEAVLMLDIPDPAEALVNLAITSPVCPNEVTGSIEVIPITDSIPIIFSIDNGVTYTINPTFDNLLPSKYGIIIQDDLGCQDTLTAVVEAPPPLAVSIIPDLPIKVRPFTPIELGTEVIGNIQTYQWLPSSIDNGLSSVSFTAIKNMDIRVVVEDDRGCKATSSLPLTIELGDIYIPNAFSPNGDGINDRFTFYSDGKSGEIIEQLQIFDRWGSLLFEAKEIPLNDLSVGWDGTTAGQMRIAGIYTFIGTVRFWSDARKQFEGSLTLTK